MRRSQAAVRLGFLLGGALEAGGAVGLSSRQNGIGDDVSVDGGMAESIGVDVSCGGGEGGRGGGLIGSRRRENELSKYGKPLQVYSMF